FPSNKAQVDQNLATFDAELSRKIVMWEKQAAALKGRPVITQHASFAYLWAWLGLKPIADLEPRPGVPPTASHLEKVLALSKTQQPAGIIIAQHHDPKPKPLSLRPSSSSLEVPAPSRTRPACHLSPTGVVCACRLIVPAIRTVAGRAKRKRACLDMVCLEWSKTSILLQTYYQ
ncbi:MAG: hypothetical protein EBX30_13805, partial [Betaproteobacteria bacterium]|nr:hypothetical protein [Betaproteobacteria bacterium]